MHKHESGTNLLVSLLRGVFVKCQNSRRREEYQYAIFGFGRFLGGIGWFHPVRSFVGYENPTKCKKDNLICSFALWDLTVRGPAAVTRMEKKWICKCELLTSGGGFDFAEEKNYYSAKYLKRDVWTQRLCRRSYYVSLYNGVVLSERVKESFCGSSRWPFIVGHINAAGVARSLRLRSWEWERRKDLIRWCDRYLRESSLHPVSAHLRVSRFHTNQLPKSSFIKGRRATAADQVKMSLLERDVNVGRGFFFSSSCELCLFSRLDVMFSRSV